MFYKTDAFPLSCLTDRHKPQVAATRLSRTSWRDTSQQSLRSGGQPPCGRDWVEEASPFSDTPAQREMSFGSFDDLSEDSGDAQLQPASHSTPSHLDPPAVVHFRHGLHEAVRAPRESSGAGERGHRPLKRAEPLPMQPKVPSTRVETSAAAAKAAWYRQQPSRLVAGPPAR